MNLGALNTAQELVLLIASSPNLLERPVEHTRFGQQESCNFLGNGCS